MARMHARRKGRSGSTRPFRTEAPEWVTLGTPEISAKITELAKEGNSSAKIGIILRDQFGIPQVKTVTGRSIVQIMVEQNVASELPEDLTHLIRKAVRLGEHLGHNPKDNHNRRGLQLTEAKILRLARYYKSSGRLPAEWKYSLKRAKLMVE